MMREPDDLIAAALASHDYDRALDVMDAIARDRALSAAELVRMGQWMLLSEGKPGRTPTDAVARFKRALTLDKDYIPALCEIGWFYYSVENDALQARRYFEHALAVLRELVGDVGEGLVNCIAELEGNRAAEVALEQLPASLLDEERIRRDLLPVDSD